MFKIKLTTVLTTTLSTLGLFLILNSSVMNAEEPSKIPFSVDESIQDEFLEVAGDLRCPTCVGLSVLESNADFSVQIKNIVKEKIQEGASKEEILDYFTDRYGAWILREPPKTGFNIIAWALPIGLMVLGPFFVYGFFWRRKQIVLTKPVRASDEILKEMEDKLSQLRGV